jgi:hypothetical protein
MIVAALAGEILPCKTPPLHSKTPPFGETPPRRGGEGFGVCEKWFPTGYQSLIPKYRKSASEGHSAWRFQVMLMIYYKKGMMYSAKCVPLEIWLQAGRAAVE